MRDTDRDAVARYLEQEWGPLLVVHGTVFHPADLPALLAERDDEPLAGLLTYQTDGDIFEIVTLNARRPLGGVGTALVEAAARQARAAGCRELFLSTTNDNTGALRFYQRRGFRLTALHPGAVARSRELKPSIPQTGEHGIPLRDELDLARSL